MARSKPIDQIPPLDPSDPYAAAIEAARGDLPTAQQLDEIARRLDSAVEAPGADAGTAASALVQSGVLIAVAGALVAGLVLGGRARVPQVPEAPPAAVPSRAAAREAPSTIVQEPPPAQAPVERSERRARRKASAARSSERSAPARAAANSTVAIERPDTLAVEMRLLRTAKAALRSDPQEAFFHAQEHARRFPAGVLGEEREVIAISALAGLGELDAARARADEFFARYPGSMHRQRVESALSNARRK